MISTESWSFPVSTVLRNWSLKSVCFSVPLLGHCFKTSKYWFQSFETLLILPRTLHLPKPAWLSLLYLDPWSSTQVPSLSGRVSLFHSGNLKARFLDTWEKIACMYCSHLCHVPAWPIRRFFKRPRIQPYVYCQDKSCPKATLSSGRLLSLCNMNSKLFF